MCVLTHDILPLLGIKSPIDNLSLDTDDLAFLQGKEENLIEIIKHPESPFLTKDGVLWKMDGSKILLVVPNDVKLRKFILELCHDSGIGEHRDLIKMIQRITSSYWWITILKDILEYIKTCDICQ